MDWRRPHPGNGREKAGGPRGGDCAAFLERLTIKRGLVVSAKPSSLRRRTSVRRRLLVVINALWNSGITLWKKLNDAVVAPLTLAVCPKKCRVWGRGRA